MLPATEEVLTEKIREAHEFLRAQKGFGLLSVTKQEILMYSSSFVASVYMKDIQNDISTATISTSISNLLIAQQAEMYASIYLIFSISSSASYSSSYSL